MTESLRLLVIGAHPDDAEYKAGGLAALYREAGHDVLYISVTDGSAGHHVISGPPLVDRRRAEAQAAAATIGLTYEVWAHPDGRLVVDLPLREQLIRRIRAYRPDLVLTHRPNDYHPDHRAVAQAVQDAAYLLTVPAICPDMPHLRRDPVIAYLADDFTRPNRFEPTVIVDITEVWDRKIAQLHAHASQFYEWLPANMESFREVPQNEGERFGWLSRLMRESTRRFADRHRLRIESIYGATAGREIHLVEAFEGSEYGAPLDKAAVARLFPFVPTLPR